MELVEFRLCRLCAKNKFPDEIVGQIDDAKLNIESKLIACCQCNALKRIASDRLTQDVCIDCFQSLQQCWHFSENIRQAQYVLQSIAAVDAKTASNSKPVIVLNESFTKPSLNSEIESPTQMEENFDSMFDIANDEVSCYTDNVIKLEPIHLSDEYEIETNENIKFEVFDDNSKTEQLKKVQLVLPNLNERKFLEAISKDDRNNDGTVKVEAIERLGIDSWASIPFQCYICHEQSLDRLEWLNHMKIAHSGHPLRHSCNICNAKHYSKRTILRKHIISVHRRHFKFCCHNCNAFFWNMKRLQGHSCGNQDRSCVCDICGREFTTNNNLQVHRVIHSPESRRIFECYMCQKRYFIRKSLSTHILMTHVNEGREFKCDVCGKEFSWRSRFSRHKKIHTNDFPFDCPHCEKKFRFKDKLVTHIRTHTGDKPFKCLLCSYCCGNDGNMSKHIRQVHGTSKTELKKRQSMQKLNN